MRKYRVSVSERLAEKFDIPNDIAANLPRMIILGYREVIIYNHRGITEYSEDRISIATGRAVIKISGVGLTIKAMNTSNISVAGQLIGIEFSY